MKIQSYCEGLKGVVEGVHKVSKALGGAETSSNIPDALQEVATAIESGGGGGGGTYTGGYGIDVVNHEISIDDNVVATKSDLPDINDYYTKEESDILLEAKANKSATYTKGEVDSALLTKADKSNTYTKAEVDALIPEDEVVYFTYYRHYPSRPVPTVSEMIEAYNAGKTVYLKVVYNQEEADRICPIDTIIIDNNYVRFANPSRIYEGAGIWRTVIYYYEVRNSGITEIIVEVPDKDTLYTKAETDTLLNAKADKATTYTKTEIDTALGDKQDKMVAGTGIDIASDNKTISVDATLDEIVSNGNAVSGRDVELNATQAHADPAYVANADDGSFARVSPLGIDFSSDPDASDVYATRLSNQDLMLYENSEYHADAVYMSTSHFNASGMNPKTGETESISFEWGGGNAYCDMSDGMRAKWQETLEIAPRSDGYVPVFKIEAPANTTMTTGWQTLVKTINAKEPIAVSYLDNVYFAQHIEKIDDATYRFIIRDETSKWARIYICHSDDITGDNYEITLYASATLPDGVIELTYNSSTLADAQYAASEGTVTIVEGTVKYQALQIQSALSNSVTFYVIDCANNRIVQYVVTNSGWTKTYTKVLA